MSHCSATRGLLATNHVILNHGQVTWTTPELAPLLLTTTPHQREDVSALDRFSMHCCSTRWVFSGTGFELVIRQATIRYLYHWATAATISGSKIVLDFDRKALAIPDSQIEKVVTTIEERNVEIDITKTGLKECQKEELQDLFNSFKGLFLDKPGFTHVFYHEIDTGYKPPVVSRPYRYDKG
ncbi:uncharacterized protein TNCV_3398091 [Trichonephila clavipes]|nr:uncharacterized protein TNCV_3398091 [Trichonephila clavipes]